MPTRRAYEALLAAFILPLLCRQLEQETYDRKFAEIAEHYDA